MNPMVCIDDGAHQHHLPHVLAKQQVCMWSGLMNDSATASAAGQREQDVAGEAAVRGVHADLPPDLEPLAHDVRQVVENLGQVAAGIALDEAPR